MSNEHVSARSFRALLAGEVEPSRRAAFIAHLEEPCEACEEALATAGLELTPDALDGSTDTALLALRESGWPADALSGQRLMRRLGRRRRTIALGAGALAMAASLALFLSIGPGLSGAPASTSRMKGGRDAPLPRLEFARLDITGTLSPVASGASLPRSGHLLLRFDSPVALCGDLLLRSGAKTLFETSHTCLARGPTTFEEDGEVIAIDLSDPSLGDHLELLFATSAGDTAQLEVRLLPTR